MATNFIALAGCAQHVTVPSPKSISCRLPMVAGQFAWPATRIQNQSVLFAIGQLTRLFCQWTAKLTTRIASLAMTAKRQSQGVNFANAKANTSVSLVMHLMHPDALAVTNPFGKNTQCVMGSHSIVDALPVQHARGPLRGLTVDARLTNSQFAKHVKQQRHTSVRLVTNRFQART